MEYGQVFKSGAIIRTSTFILSPDPLWSHTHSCRSKSKVAITAELLKSAKTSLHREKQFDFVLYPAHAVLPTMRSYLPVVGPGGVIFALSTKMERATVVPRGSVGHLLSDKRTA